MKAKNTFTTILSVLLTVVVIVLSTAYAIPTAYATENTWDPSNGVYNISTEADLFAFRNALYTDGQADGDVYDFFYNKIINLMNDITLTQDWNCNSVVNGTNGDIFAGTFNGNNHTIENINMVCIDGYSASFFPQLYHATIKDLTLKDVTVDTNRARFIGGFSCITLGEESSQNIISNCHLEGQSLIKVKDDIVKAQWTGGIIGTCQDYSGNIRLENCSVGENVIIQGQDNKVSDYYVNHFSGGLVGSADYDTNIVFDNCVNYASVYCSGSNNTVAGGLLGILNRGGTAVFNNCANYGNVTYNPGNNTSSSIVAYIGGITGGSSRSSYSDGFGNKAGVLTVNDCVNHGDIYAKYGESVGDVGGLVGQTFSASITNSYNTGNITIEGLPSVENSGITNCVGGVVGLIKVWEYDDPTGSGMRLENCYNTGSISVPTTYITQLVGGVAGQINTVSSKPNEPSIGNVYNFGSISSPGSENIGLAMGDFIFSTADEFYALQNGGFCIVGKSSNSNLSGGYFTSADVDGVIYPVTLVSGQNEVVSSEPTSYNLLQTLNNWVDEQNEALENSGESFRYLKWKMTNPASEDGSKGVTVHPMFGVLEEQGLRFHVNEPPGKTDRLFRVYDGDASEAEDTTAYTLTNGKVDDFYAIPAFAGDNYVFAGWYYNQSDGTADGNTAFDFSSAVPEGVTDVYAHWIAIGTVSKDSKDSNLISGDYRGFGLAGVQIRDPKLFDSNYNTDYNDENDRTPGGMRFVTSLSESLLSSIDALSSNKVNTTGGNVDVEYGYVVGTEKTIAEYIDGVGNNWTTPVTGHYKGVDLAKYRLLYKGENVNGVNTAGATQTADTDFRYITNVNCTRGTTNSMGTIKEDHHSFTNYRLYSLVVTYEGESESKKGENVDARAYIRYYDANGKLRVFYNDYRNASNVTYYGGCMCSFDQVSSMAIPQDPTLLEQQQQITG